MAADGNEASSTGETSVEATRGTSGWAISRLVPRVWRSDGLVALAVVLAATVIAWLRLDPITRRTLWAEDGAVFLTDALYADPFQTLLRPYGGYLHVVPRLVVEVTTIVASPARYAVVVNGLACAVAGGVAGLVYVCSRDVTESRLLRAGLAAITVVVPSLPREVLGNTANLHWFFLWLAPWLLLYRPRSRTGSVLLGVATLAGALTEIQMALFIPLAVWRWRERHGWPVRLGLLVGVTAQIVTLTHAVRPEPSGTPSDARTIVAGYLVNAVMTLWAGSASAITHVVSAFGWSVPLGAVMVSAAAALVVLRRGTPVQRLSAVVLPAASVVIWTAAFVINRPSYTYHRPAPGEAGFAVLRYATVPSMFVLAGLLLALTTISWKRWWTRASIGAVGVPVVIAVLANFTGQPTERSAGPIWSAQVAAGVEACRAHPDVDPEIDVAPDGAWVAHAPCALLGGG